mmetsp:Transcript_24783/g.48766  ORF Transcript_24783/g.48766 Transcript_24783/m.48766 type:complete len:125 (+) Transcript_24783:1-375(+)
MAVLHQQQQQQKQQQQPDCENQNPNGRAALAALGGLLAAGAQTACQDTSAEKDQIRTKRSSQGTTISTDKGKQLYIPAFVPLKPIGVLCKFADRCTRMDCQYTHPPKGGKGQRHQQGASRQKMF